MDGRPIKMKAIKKMSKECVCLIYLIVCILYLVPRIVFGTDSGGVQYLLVERIK